MKPSTQSRLARLEARQKGHGRMIVVHALPETDSAAVEAFVLAETGQPVEPSDFLVVVLKFEPDSEDCFPSLVSVAPRLAA